jgi:hypothetical protein
MDGSKPTGFIESTYFNGEIHPYPNIPLRCFYYDHPNENFVNCGEYSWIPRDDDDTDPNPEDDWPKYQNYCEYLGYDPSFIYTCYYDLWGEVDKCLCQRVVTTVTSLRDIFILAETAKEFWELLW